MATDEIKPRFIKTTPEKVGEEASDIYPTQWWLDTHRAYDGVQLYVAVETEMDKNPNDYIKVDKMRTLFTDQCEYYHVCGPCYSLHSRQQWSGSTRSRGDWRGEAEAELKYHTDVKGWCQFCDPIFGNGGWSLD